MRETTRARGLAASSPFKRGTGNKSQLESNQPFKSRLVWYPVLIGLILTLFRAIEYTQIWTADGFDSFLKQARNDVLGIFWLVAFFAVIAGGLLIVRAFNPRVWNLTSRALYNLTHRAA